VSIEKDLASREAILSELDATLFVEAGAGTGKTTSLVERIVRLATRTEERVPLGRLAAITFTNNAAAELRERVRRKLEEGLKENPKEPAWAHALSEVDEAAITTIHGFCQSILERYPLAAGLPVSFRVTVPLEAETIAAPWWRAREAEWLQDPELRSAWASAERLGVRFHLFTELGRQLTRLDPRLLETCFREREDLGASSTELWGQFVQAVANLADCLVENTDPDDKLAVAIRLLQNALKPPAPNDPVEMIERLDQLPMISGRVGAKGGWNCPVDEVKEKAKAIKPLRDRTQHLLAARALTPLLEAARQAAIDFRNHRRDTGQLTFDDLLSLTFETLRTRPEVLSEIHERFRSILVDEFQDTDPLQLEIVSLIASGTAAEPFRWQSTTPVSGRAFFVGDAKQSIYRFRGADVSVFRETRTWATPAPQGLFQNFRSNRRIIDWVNAAFQNLFDPGEFQPILSPPTAIEGTANSVRFLGESIPVESAHELRRREAEAVADSVLLAVQGGEVRFDEDARREEPWLVRDRVTKQERPTRLDDIAILIPSRTFLPYLQEALESRNVPYRNDSRTAIFESAEVRELAEVLRAVADPTDEVAVVAALRSTLFACHDQDLLDYHQAERTWNYQQASLEHNGRVTECLKCLRRWRALSAELDVSKLLDIIVRERRLLERLTPHDRPRDAWNRVFWLQDLAQRLEAQGAVSLTRFLAEIATMEERSLEVQESVMPESDDNAVRILTMHAAKGLEFPIVMLAELRDGSSRPSSLTLFERPDTGRVEFRLSGTQAAETAGFETQKETEKRLDRAERIRLLYVAATRARDHLLVSCFQQDGGKGECDGELLFQHSPPEAQRRFVPVSAVPLNKPKTHKGSLLESEEAFTARREDSVRQAKPPLRVPATGLGQHDEPEQSWQKPSSDTEAHGAGFGRAVHAVLQTIDLRNLEQRLAEAVRVQAAAENQDAMELERSVRQALAMPSVRRAAALPHYKEVFASARLEGVLVEGFLDLVYQEEDGTYSIVDYKTDLVFNEAEADRRMERYIYQAAAYAMLLREHLGREPARCVFLFVRAGIEREVDLELINRAEEKILIDLRQLGEPSASSPQ
jgi:ATP-dependent helicase/nuclease subunit A